jgi:DNA primase large subunit
VLFLTAIEEMRAEQVAEIMNTTKYNIWQIKSRAIKHFLQHIQRKIERGRIYMSDKEFITLLQKAVENNENAIIQVIRMYENLIFGNSLLNGRYDADCKGYIESCLISAIRNFKI